MIQTHGFGVDVMPQYSQVNPQLAAINPIETTHGILSALQIGGTLDQLKAFKQHAQEIADTEKIRTQLLKAQADQESIQRDRETALQEAKLGAEKASLAASTARDTSLTKLFPQRQNVESLSLENQASMLPGQGRLGLAQLATQEQVQPSLSKIAIAQAQGEAGRVQGAESIKDLQQQLAQVQAQSALDMAPDQQKLIKAKLDDDLKNAKTDADVRRALNLATVAHMRASADSLTAAAEGSGRYEKDPFVKYQKMEALEQQMERKIQDLWKEPVVLPDGTRGTLSDYFAATRNASGDPAIKRSIGNLFMGKEVARNETNETLIRNIAAIKQRQADLGSQMSKFQLSAPPEVKPVDQPVKSSGLPAGWSIKE